MNMNRREIQGTGLAALLALAGARPAAPQAQPRPFRMPPSGLTPHDMADALTCVRQAWGHRAASVTAVDTLRAP